MVQDQLVDYINAQMKLGTSRDAIKATLTGAGWQSVDVEDTLRKIESAKAVQPQPASAASVAPMSAGSAFAKPAGTPSGTVGPAPQTIKVSDLVSAASYAPAAKPAASVTPATPAKSPMTGPAMGMSATSAPAMATKPMNTYQAPASSMAGMSGKPHGSRGALITEIILVVVIVAVGGFAGFLYMQNQSLTTQLGSLNGQSTGVNSQLSTLQTQVSASTTALTAQVSTLNENIQELQTELSFYVAPSNATPGATSSVAISGTVSGGGKLPYVITALHGAKIYITNSKSTSTIAAFAPFMATTSTAATSAQFSGIYIPGSDSMTLMAVNGTAF